MADKEKEKPLSVAEARKVVSEYQDKLQTRVFDIESRFDNAVLLVAGGAFTVSAAFVPRLADGGNLSWALLTSWLAWGACLTLCVGGHLLSARCHNRRVDAISRQDFAAVHQRDFLDKSLPAVNYVTFALLICGFVFFSVYTYANLRSGGSGGQSKEESCEKDEARIAPCFERPSASTGVSEEKKAQDVKQDVKREIGKSNEPRAQEQVSETTSANVRREDTKPAGKSSAAGQGQSSSERAAPAAGLPKAPKEIAN